MDDLVPRLERLASHLLNQESRDLIQEAIARIKEHEAPRRRAPDIPMKPRRYG